MGRRRALLKRWRDQDQMSVAKWPQFVIMKAAYAKQLYSATIDHAFEPLTSDAARPRPPIPIAAAVGALQGPIPTRAPPSAVGHQLAQRRGSAPRLRPAMPGAPAVREVQVIAPRPHARSASAQSPLVGGAFHP